MECAHIWLLSHLLAFMLVTFVCFLDFHKAVVIKKNHFANLSSDLNSFSTKKPRISKVLRYDEEKLKIAYCVTVSSQWLC